MREDKDGKPIKLRLWARAESPESQKTGSLLTGWFRDLGLKIEYQVMDDGIYYDSIWAYQGNTYSPDFDMYLWNYDGYADPGDTLASFITAQIENWNEPCWSNAEYDAVVAEANTTLDPEKRKELVWRAQQIFYEQSPEIATDYPEKLEAVNTAKWDGWTRMYGGTGAAFYTSYVRDSYLNLKPKAAAAEGSNGGGRRTCCSPSSPWSWWSRSSSRRGSRCAAAGSEPPRRSDGSGAAGCPPAPADVAVGGGRVSGAHQRDKMRGGAARGPVTAAVFKTVCGAMLSSWVGSTPMSLRHCLLQGFLDSLLSCRLGESAPAGSGFVPVVSAVHALGSYSGRASAEPRD